MSRIRIINIPLFWKFSIIAILVVFAFGTINLYLLWNSVYRSFEEEIEKRCQVLSSIVATNVLSPIVYDDDVTISNVLDEIKKSDHSIAYIFILDETGKVIAKTQEFNIPKKLVTANGLILGMSQIKVINAINYKFKSIRDIAYPIMRGEIGIVRLGIVEESIRKDLNDATKNLLIMIGLFLILGLLGAFYFSYLITTPIKNISIRAQTLNLNSITEQKIKNEHYKYKKIFNWYFNDEMDLLVSKFNEMMIRLQNNISELKKTRNAFVQTEKLASIGTLTSGIGHEINNPLSGIKNCLNRMMKNPENVQQNIQYLEMIKEATDKIENVVGQLLNFSRKQHVKFEVVQPKALLERSINLALHKIEKSQIVLETNFECNHFIKVSSNHLEQVFLNLLLNAIDAINEKKISSPNLQGKIKVHTTCSNDASIIRISDNGTGIKKENQNNIFDPFYTSKEVGKGTGLGLYVSYDIIKKHQGKMTFTSIYGEGTVFIIELSLTNDTKA